MYLGKTLTSNGKRPIEIRRENSPGQKKKKIQFVQKIRLLTNKTLNIKIRKNALWECAFLLYHLTER